MRLRIVGTNLPGREFHDRGYSECTWSNVHVALGRGDEIERTVRADASEAVFEADVRVKPDREGRPELVGPLVRGKPGDRWLYLSWGRVGDDGSFDLFRAAKLPLSGIDPALLEAAGREGHVLEARLPLTDARGGPLCARVPAGLVSWRVADA